MKLPTTRLSIVLLSVALASCMVLPVSKGPFPDSRQNIADEVPAFIVSGVTPRAEVLLRLGDPDGATEDDRRFIYVKRVRTGGHEIALCGVGPPGGGGGGTCNFWTTSEMAYDRLAIQFDDKNVVTSSTHERITCTEETRSPGSLKSATPCVDVAHLDLKLKTDGVVFPHAIWCRGVLSTGWRLERESASGKACPEGILVIGDAAILLYPSNANNKTAPTLTLPYTEISSVEDIKTLLMPFPRVAVKKVDGTFDTIEVWSMGAVELLLSRWRTAKSK